LITGQNPHSSGPAAQTLIAAVKKNGEQVGSAQAS